MKRFLFGLLALATVLTAGPAPAQFNGCPEGFCNVAGSGGGDPCDASGNAVVAAFTTPPTTPRRALICNTVNSLKSAGLWDTYDAIYVAAAADSQAATVNWKQPGTYTLSLVSAPAFTADRGFAGNGSSSYMDSTFTASTAITPQFVQNSAHVSAWSLTVGGAIAGSARIIGSAANTTNRVVFSPRNDATNAVGLINATASSVYTNTLSDGFFNITRTSSTAVSIYRNAVSAISASVASTGVPTSSIAFDRDSNGATNGTYQLAIMTIGSGHTQQNQTDAYTTFLNYLQAVGAQ